MDIQRRIIDIQNTIKLTAAKCGRDPRQIQLLAVSKGQSVSSILEAHAAGITNFGESYWQEAQIKISQLANLNITWHFIGSIQSNKTAAIATNFSWIHSIDNYKIINLLSKYRPDNLPPLNICIQLNLDNEPNKAGIHQSAIYDLIKNIDTLPKIKLRGLMAIPKTQTSEAEQYTSFLRIQQIFVELNRNLRQPLDTLSMGMSGDFITAIRASSTIVRIGSGIFGSNQ